MRIMNLFLILMLFFWPVFFFSKTSWINFNFSQFHEHIFRSSHSQLFIKIGVLKSFSNFTGKHLCWSLFLKSLQAEGLQIYLKSLQHMCFPVKFVKFLRTHFFTEHLRWLPLHFGGCVCILFKVIQRLLLFQNLVTAY